MTELQIEHFQVANVQRSDLQTSLPEIPIQKTIITILKWVLCIECKIFHEIPAVLPN